MKKLISVILAICIISSMAVMAFAQDRKKLVVLGDSIAWGTGVYNSEEACYGRIVANTNGYDYVNYGRDGTRSWDLLDRIHEDKVKNDLIDADIVNISIGGNDYLQQNLLVLIPEIFLGIDTNMDNIERDFGEYLDQIIGYIKELNPDALIILNVLYNPEWGILGYIYGQAVERVNRQIYAYNDAHPGDVVLMDVSTVINGYPEATALDTIHPSAVGNERIAKVMLGILKEYGLGDNLEPVVLVKGIDELPYTSYILEFLLAPIEALIPMLLGELK